MSAAVAPPEREPAQSFAGASAGASAGAPPGEGAAARVATLATLPAAVLLWVVSLFLTDVADMGDLGLIDALHPTWWLAVVVLTASFVFQLLRPRLSVPLLTAHVVTLIAILHATPSILYETLRYAWAWKHVEIIDYLVRHGATDPDAGPLDAYHQWPGFFALSAFIVKATGLEGAAGFAAWGPPFFNLLMLGPLVLIYRHFTRSRRLLWTAIWVFYCTSWVGQDYFAPQASALFLYLVVVAVILRSSATGPGTVLAGAWRADLPPDPTRGDRVRAWARGLARGRFRGLAADLRTGIRDPRVWLLPLPVIGIVTTHQLTPLMTIMVLTCLALLRAYRPAAMWAVIFTVLTTVVWFGTVARSFVMDRALATLSTFGDIGSNSQSTIGGLGEPTPGQNLVATADRALTVGVVLLAAVGLWRWRSLRRGALVPLLVGPVLMLAANSYGGEVIFRVYLFALPAAAFLMAAALRPAASRRSRRAAAARNPRRPWFATWAHGVALVLVMLLCTTGFLFGYYGKERGNRFTPDEVAVMEQLRRTAPEGSVLMGVSFNFPGAYAYYEIYDREWIVDLPPQTQLRILDDPAHTLALMLVEWKAPDAFVVLTRSQGEMSDMTGALPRGAVGAIDRALSASPEFTVAYRNHDAVIFRLSAGAVPATAPGAPGPAAPAATPAAPPPAAPAGTPTTSRAPATTRPPATARATTPAARPATTPTGARTGGTTPRVTTGTTATTATTGGTP